MRIDDPLAQLTDIRPTELADRLTVFRDPESHPSAHKRLLEMLTECGVRPQVSCAVATPADVQRDVRMQVAEVAYRYDHGHPRAMDVFLASALPLAGPTARRRAARIFVHPSDLQIELMYGGAVEAVIAVFQTKCALKPAQNAFRRYLLRSMVLGAVRAYFRREENYSIRATADLAALAATKWRSRTDAEDEIITWELLDRVTTFPQLRPPCGQPLSAFVLLAPIMRSSNMLFRVRRPGRVEAGTVQKADPRPEGDRSGNGSEQSKGASIPARGPDHSPPGIQSRREAVSDSLNLWPAFELNHPRASHCSPRGWRFHLS